MGTRAVGRPRPEPRGRRRPAPLPRRTPVPGAAGTAAGGRLSPGVGAGWSRPTRVPRPPLQRRSSRAAAACRVGRAHPEERRVWKVVAKLRRSAGGGGCQREKPASCE